MLDPGFGLVWGCGMMDKIGCGQRAEPTGFVATPVEKHSCKMRTSIVLGVFCFILSQFDFGAGSAIGPPAPPPQVRPVTNICAGYI